MKTEKQVSTWIPGPLSPAKEMCLYEDYLALQAQADKLAEALEFMTMPITGNSMTIESLLETINNDDEVGLKALSAYNKFKEEVGT